MRFISARKNYSTYAKTGLLGLALIGLANCSSGDSSTPAVTSGGSAALQGPIAFVNNRDDKTLSVVGTDTQGTLRIVSTMPSTDFEANAIGDMQFSSENWLFVNLGAGNKVATIDPISGATPIHEANLATGTRPVHIYRDPTDGEVIWSMNDGDPTNGNDPINCATGTSVTVLHNSHIGPGGNPPTVEGTTCTLASGHQVTAFSQPTTADATIPKYAAVSQEKGGQIAFLDNNQSSPTYRSLVARLDLCTDAGQASLTPAGAACDNESATAITVPFTANGSNPHGIRWSKAVGKIYSMQTGYKEIVEVDPKLIVAGLGDHKTAITRRLSLAGTPYVSYGITPDGRFLFLRGSDLTTDPTKIIGKLAVVDLAAAGPLTITPVMDLDHVVPSTFKFAPNGQRMYLLASDTTTGNAAQLAAQKKNRLFVFNPSAFPAAPQQLAEITLLSAAGHNFDVLVQGAGQGNAVLVSNGTAGSAGSVSLINSSHQLTNSLLVGANPGSVMYFSSGAAAAGNQATSSLTGGSAVASTPLAERLDDHGMPE
ncbi:MAG: hypothetical protein LZF86_110857 [Nitrospira sp.]|nr:MAG: hypothetical protein LZF86_110857 [Nitrospira sp.]